MTMKNKKETQKNTIIFDLWNTLVEKRVHTSQKLCDYFNIKRTESFVPKYERIVQTKKWDSPKDLSVHFLKSFELPISNSNIEYVTKTFQEGYNSALPLKGVKELLSKLKPNYNLAILSNTSVFEVLKKEWGMHKYFDTIAYSWETGHLKPEKKSFERVYEALGIKPNNCIFVDDLQKNVSMAKSYGVKSILFENVNKLEKKLNL